MSRLVQAVSDLMTLAQNDQLAKNVKVPWVSCAVEVISGFKNWPHEPNDDRDYIYFHETEVKAVRDELTNFSRKSNMDSMLAGTGERLGVDNDELISAVYTALADVHRSPVTPHNVQPARHRQPTPVTSNLKQGFSEGDECEVYVSDADNPGMIWCRTVVKGIHMDGGVFCQMDGNWMLFNDPTKIRPVRTRREEVHARFKELYRANTMQSGKGYMGASELVDKVLNIVEEVYGNE